VVVWALPDAPPIVRLELPRQAIWIERLPGVALRATADDPEDGPIPDGGIRWRGDGLARGLRGGSLPIEILPEAEQTVTAEAVDRWGRRGGCSATIRPFRYRLAAEPLDCMKNAAAAFQARDPEGWMGQTGAGFRFLPCAEEAAVGWETIWDRALFARRLHAWLTDADVGPPRLSWQPGRPSVWATGGDSLAWLPLSGIELRFSHVREPAGDEDGVSGGAAELLLAKEGVKEGDSVWRIVQWRDFPGRVGPSLASILAQSDGMPAAPEGRRCGPEPRGRPP
jgi:hypothetical protein